MTLPLRGSYFRRRDERADPEPEPHLLRETTPP
jgi:hypothetical protein